MTLADKTKLVKKSVIVVNGWKSNDMFYNVAVYGV